MRLINIFIIIFLMSAFAIGTSLKDVDVSVIDNSFKNASNTINNITLTGSTNSYSNGILKVTETYIKFVSSIAFEVSKLGMYFGKENPQYFEPDFIISICILIIWLVIIGLLIKPIFYLCVIIIMSFLFIREKVIKRNTLTKSKEDK